MNNPIFQKRTSGYKPGLSMYFYNVRTLMLFNYEILYNISEGAWNNHRYPEGHEVPWVEADLYLTNGKVNVRNVVNIGCTIPKNDYNLKKLMNIPTSLKRMLTIGKLCEAISNTDILIRLFDFGVHEKHEFDIYGYEEGTDLTDEYNEFLKLRHGLEYYVSYELYCHIVSTTYTEGMLRDDLGMIQNTMRNIMTLDNE